jgi:hypothetical protein
LKGRNVWGLIWGRPTPWSSRTTVPSPCNNALNNTQALNPRSIMTQLNCLQLLNSWCMIL